jgi:hypothetical protein
LKKYREIFHADGSKFKTIFQICFHDTLVDSRADTQY